MRHALLAALIVVPSLPLGMSRADADPLTAAGAARVPVLVELFTSEGCSSCPPAGSLAATQPVPGVEVVALGEHVDYWDRLGWRDRFSSPRFTARQLEYQREVFRAGTSYTPQVVVDGTTEAIGSDAAALRRALARAAEWSKLEVGVVPGAREGDRFPVTIRIGAAAQPAESAQIWLAIVEDGLVSEVGAGENRGRTLTHAAVVRRLDLVSQLETGDLSEPRDEPVTATIDVRLLPDWNRSNLRLVAFVQEIRSHRVVGVGAAAQALE
jgi:hypothetical protein